MTRPGLADSASGRPLSRAPQRAPGPPAPARHARTWAPWALRSVARAGLQPGTLRPPPALALGRCESANPSRSAPRNPLDSQCERFSGTLRIRESVPTAHPENVRKRLALRSHIVVLQKGRPTVEPEPRSSRGDRGFAFLASCRGDARAWRSRSRSPCPRWRVRARRDGRPIALSGRVSGGDWGERARGPFNSAEISFYSRRAAPEISNPFSAESATWRAATLLVNLARGCSTRA